MREGILELSRGWAVGMVVIISLPSKYPPSKINEDIELSKNPFAQAILGQFRRLKLKS